MNVYLLRRSICTSYSIFLRFLMFIFCQWKDNWKVEKKWPERRVPTTEMAINVVVCQRQKNSIKKRKSESWSKKKSGRWCTPFEIPSFLLYRNKSNLPFWQLLGCVRGMERDEEKRRHSEKKRTCSKWKQSSTKKWMEWKIISFESGENECAHQREKKHFVSFTRRQRPSQQVEWGRGKKSVSSSKKMVHGDTQRERKKL